MATKASEVAVERFDRLIIVCTWGFLVFVLGTIPMLFLAGILIEYSPLDVSSSLVIAWFCPWAFCGIVTIIFNFRRIILRRKRQRFDEIHNFLYGTS